MALGYELSFGGVPFVLDESAPVQIFAEHREGLYDKSRPPRKHQSEQTLISELNRILPFQYLVDYVPPTQYPGRNLGALGQHKKGHPYPGPQVRIGEFFYPTGASRWSVFRGLATSSMAKEMEELALVGGTSAQTFTMKAIPDPLPPDKSEGDYTVETSMYMLPPRPLAETTGFDGLYLITLVDERYYFQWRPATTPNMGWPYPFPIGTHVVEWADLISKIATALGISVSTGSIHSLYTQPEPDSALWAQRENAAVLLDACAANIGKVVVRSLGGSFSMQTPAQAADSAADSRGNALKVWRMAGGDILDSGIGLNVGNLQDSINAIVPASIDVVYPQYVYDNQPVPYFISTKYRNQRPTCWYQESYGDAWVENVPIESGNAAHNNYCVSGMDGIGKVALHTTARALFSGESAPDPINLFPANPDYGIRFQAMRLAQDFYGWQAAKALDEVYPGTFAWEPEGIHDILWTYSGDRRQASTRVFRAAWNQDVREFQVCGPVVSGVDPPVDTHQPRGLGGPVVPLTVKDRYNLSGLLGDTTLFNELLSGDFTAVLTNVHYLPTDHRWRAMIEREAVLFEGTGGDNTVGIVKRGIDSTIQVFHPAGSPVLWTMPDTNYGTNLVRFDHGFFAHPNTWNNGLSEATVLCPLRTVRVLSNSGTYGSHPNSILDCLDHWSGELFCYDPTKCSGQPYISRRLIWVVERDQKKLHSGWYYDGQLVGYSDSGWISPIYLVNDHKTEQQSSGPPAPGRPGLPGESYWDDDSKISYRRGGDGLWYRTSRYDELSKVVFTENYISGTTSLAATVGPLEQWQEVGGFGNYTITMPPVANSQYELIGFEFNTSGNLLSGDVTLDGNTAIKGPRGSQSTRKYGEGEVVVFKNIMADAWWVKHETMREDGFYATNLAAQSSITTATPTKMVMDTARWDLHADYDTTASRHTPKRAGIYNYGGIGSISSLPLGSYIELSLYKNGALYKTLMRISNGATQTAVVCGSTEATMNGTTDYMELYIEHSAGVDGSTVGTEATAGFWGTRIRRDES